MTYVELRNLAAKLRTIWANPQDNVFIYKAADELEKLTQQVAAPKVTVELPDGDERAVKTWFTEMINGELVVSISVDTKEVELTTNQSQPTWKAEQLDEHEIRVTSPEGESWRLRSADRNDSFNNFIWRWAQAMASQAATMLEADAQEIALYAGTLESRDRNLETMREENVRLAQQVAVPHWTLAADKMPEPCTNVLAYNGKKQPIRAQWGPAKTLEASGEYGEYGEATDENWWPEGWCEAKAHEEAYWLDDKP